MYTRFHFIFASILLTFTNFPCIYIYICIYSFSNLQIQIQIQIQHSDSPLTLTLTLTLALQVHEAKPVKKGRKFAANTWIHLYDLQLASAWQCAGGVMQMPDSFKSGLI